MRAGIYRRGELMIYVDSHDKVTFAFKPLPDGLNVLFVAGAKEWFEEGLQFAVKRWSDGISIAGKFYACVRAIDERALQQKALVDYARETHRNEASGT